MTKAIFEAIVADYGNKIVSITFDNSYVLFLNYRSAAKDKYHVRIDDLTIKTYDDMDFLVIPQYDKMNGYNKYETLAPLMHIQRITVTDKEKAYVDPNILK